MSKAKPRDDLLVEILLAWRAATDEARKEALAYLQAAVGDKRH